MMKYEEHKEEDWAKKPWEERVRQPKPKKLVKFTNAADMSIMKIKVSRRQLYTLRNMQRLNLSVSKKKELVGADQVAWIDFIGEGTGIFQLRDKNPEEIIQAFTGGEQKIEFSEPTGESMRTLIAL